MRCRAYAAHYILSLAEPMHLVLVPTILSNVHFPYFFYFIKCMNLKIWMNLFVCLLHLQNIIGQEAGKSVIDEYLKRRGHSEIGSSCAETPSSKLHVYVKPPSNEVSVSGTKKQSKAPKEVTLSSNQENRVPPESIESKNAHRGNQGNSKKKKAGKVVSLADAAKGSIVFQQGKPCSCQASFKKGCKR